MKRWTNGLPGATKRLGANLALGGLSGSESRMRADTHDGPEHDAPLQRPNTLLQLSRSSILEAILYRAAGPYIWHKADLATRLPTGPLSARSGHARRGGRMSAFGAKRTFIVASMTQRVA